MQCQLIATRLRVSINVAHKRYDINIIACWGISLKKTGLLTILINDDIKKVMLQQLTEIK